MYKKLERHLTFIRLMLEMGWPLSACFYAAHVMAKRQEGSRLSAQKTCGRGLGR